MFCGHLQLHSYKLNQMKLETSTRNYSELLIPWQNHRIWRRCIAVPSTKRSLPWCRVISRCGTIDMGKRRDDHEVVVDQAADASESPAGTESHEVVSHSAGTRCMLHPIRRGRCEPHEHSGTYESLHAIPSPSVAALIQGRCYCVVTGTFLLKA